MFYAALTILAALVSAGAALTETEYPWAAKPTSAERVAEAGIISFLIGCVYLMLGRDTDISAWAWAGATMMFAGSVVGLVGFTYVVSKVEMEKQPSVTAARSNPNRGPRSYAPPRIYRAQ